LPNRVNDENGRCSGNRGRVGYCDPWAHAQAEGKFPFTAHVRTDSDEEVANNELVRPTVEQPLIQACRPMALLVGTTAPVIMLLPKISEVLTGLRSLIQTRMLAPVDYKFPDAIDVYRGSCNERDYEDSRGRQECWDHDHTKPPDVEPVLCRCHEVANTCPQ
jgi:hypothetical protein